MNRPGGYRSSLGFAKRKTAGVPTREKNSTSTTAMSTEPAERNGKPISCETPGCEAQVHGRGLCRRHYDLRRYQERIGKEAEQAEEAKRESLIESELRLGCVADFQSPPGAIEYSMFGSDEERREAWEARRDRLMADWPHVWLHQRPWAWWRYEAGREEHLFEYPLDFGGTQDEHADLLDEWHNEPVVWLAANGHLRADEIAAITEDANIARPRIGTPGEHIGSGGVDRADVRAVKLYEAVTEAAKNRL